MMSSRSRILLSCVTGLATVLLTTHASAQKRVIAVPQNPTPSPPTVPNGSPRYQPQPNPHGTTRFYGPYGNGSHGAYDRYRNGNRYHGWSGRGYDPYHYGYSPYGYNGFGVTRGFGISIGRGLGINIYSGPVRGIDPYGYNVSPYGGFGNYGYTTDPYSSGYPGRTQYQTWPPNNVGTSTLNSTDGGLRMIGTPQPIADPARNIAPLPEASSGLARQRSLNSRILGDEAFRKQDYSSAMQRYTTAYETAKDVPDNHFRMALALVAMTRYDAAVTRLKRGLQIDPAWPAHPLQLTDLLGDDNEAARSRIMAKVLRWVQDDLHDPDRLFLLGVMLWPDRPDQARTMFEGAHTIAGGGEHLTPFLNARIEPVQNPNGTDVRATPDANGEPGPFPKLPLPAEKLPETKSDIDMNLLPLPNLNPNSTVEPRFPAESDSETAPDRESETTPSGGPVLLPFQQ